MQPHQTGPGHSGGGLQIVGARSFSRRFLIGVLSTALLGVLSGVAFGAAPLSASPLLSSNPNGSLLAVSALSSSDAWAVGIRGSRYPNGFKTLTQHWDGRHWTRIHAPNPGSPNWLESVADVSPTDAWAGGFYYSGGWHTMMLHWGGTDWNLVKSPDVGGVDSFAVINADDIWAAGMNEYGTGGFVQHWDGSSWTLVNTPDPAYADAFPGITATSDNDAWVVGYTYQDAQSGHQKTLTEHWDGNSWAVVKSADPDRKYQTLLAVSAASPTDVWTVGQYGCDGCGALTDRSANRAQITLTEHWDGAGWTTVDSPGNREAELDSVSSVVPDDAWAVGSNHFITTIEHWDGTAWATADSPQPPDSSNLSSVAAITSRDVWAVGSSTNSGDSFRTWVEHWNGAAWTEF